MEETALQQRRRPPMRHHVAWNGISALLSFTYRTKPPLHSGFVGRPRATLEKRIPINSILITIGEALGRAGDRDDSLGAKIARLPSIIGLRNRLVHGYSAISPDESPTSVDTLTLNPRAIHHAEPVTRRRLRIHADRVSRRKDLPRELRRRQASAQPPSMFERHDKSEHLSTSCSTDRSDDEKVVPNGGSSASCEQ